MARCEVCGNDYDLAFEVITAGESHVFDSLECAIQRPRPHLRALRLRGHRTWGSGGRRQRSFLSCLLRQGSWEEPGAGSRLTRERGEAV